MRPPRPPLSAGIRATLLTEFDAEPGPHHAAACATTTWRARPNAAASRARPSAGMGASRRSEYPRWRARARAQYGGSPPHRRESGACAPESSARAGGAGGGRRWPPAAAHAGGGWWSCRQRGWAMHGARGSHGLAGVQGAAEAPRRWRPARPWRLTPAPWAAFRPAITTATCRARPASTGAAGRCAGLRPLRRAARGRPHGHRRWPRSPPRADSCAAGRRGGRAVGRRS